MCLRCTAGEAQPKQTASSAHELLSQICQSGHLSAQFLTLLGLNSALLRVSPVQHCDMQAFLKAHLRVIHIVASDDEAARVLGHYAAREQSDSNVSRAIHLPAVAQDGPEGMWQLVREVKAGGAIIVRPDGHVGWRCSGPPVLENGADHRTPGLTHLRYSDVLCAAVQHILRC